ncbi:MAG: B12-binding domain-containing radical SAM protein [Promethearchaeota archaeon]
MKITFLNPNLGGEFRLNVGLAALITYVKERTHHEVDLIDVTFHRRNWRKFIRKKVRSFKPDVVGVSALTYNFYDSLQIVSFIKTLLPDVHIVYGGIHPSTCPESTIKVKFIDSICVGEGEFVVEELLDALESGKSLEGINGLWYKDGNTIVKNPPSRFIEDLDSLPFIDWTLFEVDKYKIVNPYEISILASRGCPFNCTYCINPVLRGLQEGKYVRFRKPEKIIRELVWQVKKLGDPSLRYFYFWDDMFNLNSKFIEEFCRLFVEKKFHEHFSWSCSSRVDTVSEKGLRTLRAANLNLTRMGIEAGNYNVRKQVYDKDLPTRDVIRVMKLCKEYGIKTQTDFILAGPRESYRNLVQTFTLMRLIEPDEVSINLYQPYPRIKSNEIFLRDGGRILSEEWKNVRNFFFNSAIEHPRITRKALRRIVVRMNIYFLMSVLWRHLKKQKLRLLFDILRYGLFLKWKYGLLWHDLFKMTVRKYIYEENLPRNFVARHLFD